MRKYVKPGFLRHTSNTVCISYDLYMIYANSLHLYSLSSPNMQVTFMTQVHGHQMMKILFKGRVL